MNLSVGYVHGRYKDFTLPDGSNYNGFQLQYAPTWTVSAGYSHDFALAGGYLRAKVGTRYESAFFADFNHTPGGRQQPYMKSDASLTYHPDNAKWSLGIWIKNIENEPVIAATAGGSNIPFNPLAASSFLEAPRTFGLRATLSL
jgi:iron complex outermembrane receptor protein